MTEFGLRTPTGLSNAALPGRHGSKALGISRRRGCSGLFSFVQVYQDKKNGEYCRFQNVDWPPQIQIRPRFVHACTHWYTIKKNSLQIPPGSAALDMATPFL
jgi:hypothetical protein